MVVIKDVNKQLHVVEEEEEEEKEIESAKEIIRINQ